MLIYIVALSLFAGLIALIGGLLFLSFNKLTGILENVAIPYAAGVLITTALLGLIPEALEHFGEQALLIVLITFFSAFVVERLFFDIHHHTGHGHQHNLTPIAWMVIVGDTIHNFIDGVAIGASVLIHPALGAVTALSTFLHEVPHEIGDFGVLLRAGWKKRSIILVNATSSLASVIGAIMVYFLPPSDTLLGIWMSIAAGLFLYLGSVDFLPHLEHSHKDRPYTRILPLLLGAATMFITLSLIPHHP